MLIEGEAFSSLWGLFIKNLALSLFLLSLWESLLVCPPPHPLSPSPTRVSPGEHEKGRRQESIDSLYAPSVYWVVNYYPYFLYNLEVKTGIRLAHIWTLNLLLISWVTLGKLPGVSNWGWELHPPMCVQVMRLCRKCLAGTKHPIISSIKRDILWVRMYLLHFLSGETEVQGCWRTCPRWQKWVSLSSQSPYLLWWQAGSLLTLFEGSRRGTAYIGNKQESLVTPKDQAADSKPRVSVSWLLSEWTLVLSRYFLPPPHSHGFQLQLHQWTLLLLRSPCEITAPPGRGPSFSVRVREWESWGKPMAPKRGWFQERKEMLTSGAEGHPRQCPPRPPLPPPPTPWLCYSSHPPPFWEMRNHPGGYCALRRAFHIQGLCLMLAL